MTTPDPPGEPTRAPADVGPRPAGPSWAVPAPAAPPRPPPPGPERSFPGWAVAAPAPAPTRPGRPPRVLLLLGLAALVVAGGAVAVRSRATGTTDGPVAPEVVGACVAYGTGEPRRVERLVPCSGLHDGRVLAFAPAASGCPAATDAVLGTVADAAGDGVLCVAED